MYMAPPRPNDSFEPIETFAFPSRLATKAMSFRQVD